MKKYLFALYLAILCLMLFSHNLAQAQDNWISQGSMNFCTTGEIILALQKNQANDIWVSYLDNNEYTAEVKNGYWWIRKIEFLSTNGSICEPYSKISDFLKGSVVAMTLARSILPYTPYANLSVHIALGAAAGATVVFLVEKFCDDYFETKNFEKTLVQLQKNGCDLIEIQSKGQARCLTTPTKSFIHVEGSSEFICPLRSEKKDL